MKSFKYLLILLFFALHTSCKSGDDEGFVPSPYVQNIISDKSSHEFSVFSSCQTPLRGGDIAVAGSLDRCLSFSQMFLASDSHDNVSGRSGADGLPDFSGEKITLFPSKIGLIPSDSIIYMGISQLVYAIDTIYHLSPYELEGLGHKGRSKILVFADASHYASCKDDIDYLLSWFGSSFPVVFPAEVATRACMKRINSDAVSVGYVCDSIHSEYPEYDRILSDVSVESGKTVRSQFTFMIPDNCENPMIAFMDAYIASGNSSPLDAIVLDSNVYDVSCFESISGSFRSVLSPEFLSYGRYLATDFSVVGVYEATADYCYNLLRKRNLFTHNICFPYTESYCIVRHPDSTNHSFILVPYVI